MTSDIIGLSHIRPIGPNLADLRTTYPVLVSIQTLPPNSLRQGSSGKAAGVRQGALSRSRPDCPSSSRVTRSQTSVDALNSSHISSPQPLIVDGPNFLNLPISRGRTLVMRIEPERRPDRGKSPMHSNTSSPATEIKTDPN